VGWAVDRVLFYGTAGGAFGNNQSTFNGTTTTNTQAGWTAGVGVEVAFADNWTAKVEYLYVDLGTFNGNCATTTCIAASPTGAPIPFNIKATDNLVRVGLNYKFNF
jgi:outer membrane immunogenic protein